MDRNAGNRRAHEGRTSTSSSQGTRPPRERIGRGLHALGSAALVALTACGGQQPPQEEGRGSALVYEACTEARLSWTNPASRADKCAGGWEYSVPSTPTCYVQAPSISCPGSSYPQGKECNHAHTRGTPTVTSLWITPTATPIYNCLQWAVSGTRRWCSEPGDKIIGYRYSYPTGACATAASQALARYPDTNLNLRAGITATTSLTYPNGSQGAPALCTVTLSNAPLSWHKAVDDTLCAASPTMAQDLERPTLVTCRGSTVTSCAASPADAYVRVCSTTGNVLDPNKAACGVNKKYSAAGVSLDELVAGDPSAAVLLADPTYKATCLTDENMPMRSGGSLSAQLVQDKYTRLRARFDQAVPAGLLSSAPDVLLLRKALTSKLKLLLEQAGHLLTQEQRRVIVAHYTSMPNVQEGCGDVWTPPDESAPLAGLLQMCHRLATGSAVPEVIEAGEGSRPEDWALSDQCADVLRRAGELAGDYPNRQIYLDEARASAVEALKRAFAVLPGADESQRRQSLQRHLRTLGSWYRAAESGAYATQQFLSDLPYAEPVVTWAPAKRDLSIAGNPLRLAGRQYSKGMGAHAESELVFDLAGRGCRYFFAELGVDDETTCASTTAGFEVYGDGVKLFDSGPLGKGQPPRPASLDIANRRFITLKSTLADGQNWCDHTDWASARVACPSTGDRERLWRDASAILGSLEMGLYRRDVDWLKSGLKDDLALRSYLVTSFARDRELLTALFTEYVPPPGLGQPALPLTSAPALLVFADGFRPMHERLGEMVPYHDYACRFLKCRESGLASEVSWLETIVGGLADPVKLEAAVASAQALSTSLPAGGFSADWPKWKALFDDILKKDASGVSRHAKVVQAAAQDALGTGSYSPSQVEAATPAATPPVAALAALVAEASRRTANFAASGLFATDQANQLPIPLLKDNLPIVLGNARNRHAALASAIGQYRASRTALVDTLIRQIETGGATDSEATKRQDLALRMAELSEDALGLKLRSSIEAAQLGARGADYASLMNTLKDALGQQYMTVTPIDNWGAGISGGDGRYVGPGIVTSVADVAVTRNGAAKVLTAKAGQVVTILAQGTWAPTCALQISPSLGGVPVVPGAAGPSIRGAQTGPQGYTLAYASGTFETRSHTDAMSESWYHKEEACAGLKFELPLGGATPAGPWGIPGLSFSAGIQACGGYSWSSTWTRANTSGSDKRTMANFAMGLRLPNTPFPEAPAGSLLAVITPRDTPNARLDVQVLQAPFSTITFPEAADLYFVVNDAKCPAGLSAGGGIIRVDLTVAEPKLQKMIELGTAMEETMASLRARGDAIVGQGRMLPGDANLIRSDAWAKLKARCACDLSPYPEAVRDYFGAWLEAEIWRIENALAELTSRREMQHLMLQAATVDQDFDTLARKGRLQTMFAMDTLRHLDVENAYLRGAASLVARGTTAEIWPYTRLRYPEVLDFTSATDTAENAQLAALLRFDWEMGSLDTLAGAFRNANEAVLGRLDFAVTTYPVYSKRVLVRFPNARYQTPPLPFAGKTVGEDRSGPLWDAIRAGQGPKIRIELLDLYRKVGGGRLACNEMTPAVKAMALHFAVPDCLVSPCSAWNAQRVDSDTQIGRVMDWALPGGPVPFLYGNPAGLLPTTRFIYGTDAFALETFDGLRAQVPDIYAPSAKGVSPFTTFEFAPFGAWADPDRTVESVSLILDIETRTAASDVVVCP